MYQVPLHFRVNRTIMAPSACTVHTTASAPCSENAQIFLLRTTFLAPILSEGEARRTRCPRGSWVPPRGHPDLLLRRRELTITDRVRRALPTRRTACARSRRPGPVVPRRPCEPVRLAGPGLERAAVLQNPAPREQGPEAPAVRPSAARTRAPGLGRLLGGGGVARLTPGEHLATSRPASSPPKGLLPKGRAQPPPRARAPPLPPPGLARGEEAESRWPDPAACATRAGAGGSGQGTRSRAPVGRAHSPPFSAPPRPPRSRWLQESIVTADFSRQLQLSNSSANN